MKPSEIEKLVNGARIPQSGRSMTRATWEVAYQLSVKNQRRMVREYAAGAYAMRLQIEELILSSKETDGLKVAHNVELLREIQKIHPILPEDK